MSKKNRACSSEAIRPWEASWTISLSSASRFSTSIDATRARSAKSFERSSRHARTSAIYRAFGAEGRFRAELRPGGHVFTVEDQEGAFAWLRETWEEAAGGPQAGPGRPRMSELSKQASG